MIRGLILTAVACLSLGAQTFEVASIKPAAPMDPGRIRVGIQGGPGTAEPGQMDFNNVSLAMLIQDAYDVKDYQVSGPGWLQSTRFDVIAKVPAGATKAQSRIMLQNLLADRFRLVVHHSTKEASIYALVVAKNGPKLKESAPVDANAAPADGHPPDGPPRDGVVAGPRMAMGKDGMPQLPPGARRGAVMMMGAPGGRMRIVANGTTIEKFLGPLGIQLDRPVVDMTGLTGTYDITLDFAPDPSIMQAKMAAMGVGAPPGMEKAGPPPDGAGSADAGPAATIFSALPDQLGLRLEARKGPVDLVVVDSMEKTPTEN